MVHTENFREERRWLIKRLAMGLFGVMIDGISFPIPYLFKTKEEPLDLRCELTTPKISFEEAKNYPEKRQVYIDQIVAGAGGLPEYVASVKYLTQEEFEKYRESSYFLKKEKGTMMFTHFDFDTDTFGKGVIKPEVFVVPYCFDSNITNDADFTNSLVDHEFKHASAAYKGLEFADYQDFRIAEGVKKTNLDLFHCVYELVAIRNEKNIGRERGISKMHGSAVLTRYANCYLDIWNTEKVNPEFRKKLQIMFFEPFMMKHPEGFGIDKTAAGEKWYLKDKKGRMYYLPDEIKTMYSK